MHMEKKWSCRWVLWFKVAISVADLEDPKTYRSRCIDLVSDDT